MRPTRFLPETRVHTTGINFPLAWLHSLRWPGVPQLVLPLLLLRSPDGGFIELFGTFISNELKRSLITVDEEISGILVLKMRLNIER